MKLALALLLGILVGILCFGRVKDVHSLDIPAMLDGTVALVDGEHVYCAGVWISSSEILTAEHCVSNKDWVNYYDYRDFTAGKFYGGRFGKVIRTSTSADLGLIKVILEDHQHRIVPIYKKEVVAGMDGHIIGHPGGKVYTYMRGWVSAIRYTNGSYYFQVSAPVYFGNSGGGMFDDRGRLLGISSAMGMRAPAVGYFVSHQEILVFLNSEESF